MGLQWKIALALATVAAAATISVGMLSYRATSNRLMEEVDRALDDAMDEVQPRPRAVLVNRGLLDVYLVQLLDRVGEPSASSIDEPIGPGAGADVADDVGERSYDTVDATGGDLRALTVGVPGGAIQVLRSLEENERVLTDLRRDTIVLVAVVTAGAALVGWLLARTVTGPLVRLTRAATDVEQSGRLDVDIPVRGRDEVGRLGTAFDGMLNALAASRADQQRLVQDAGHELRTPLTSVRTNLAVLRRHPDLDPETRRKVLDDLHAEVEELVVLVEEVVALAQGAIDDTPPTRDRARASRPHGRRAGRTAPRASGGGDRRPVRRRSPVAGRRAGAVEPRRQRGEVRPVGWSDRGDGRGRCGHRARPGTGHPGGGRGPRLRPLLPG